MGKKKAKPPPAPDYAAIAKQQAADQNQLLDKQTAANRVNQVNPWGEVAWSQDGAGNWTQKTTLNDQQQQALDGQMALQNQRTQTAQSAMQRANDAMSRPFDTSGLMGWGGAPQAREVRAGQGPQAEYIQAGQGPQAERITAAQSPDAQYIQAGQGPEAQYVQGGRMQMRIGQTPRYVDQAGDALYNQATSRLDPRYGQQEDQMRTRLMNMGLKPGDRAWDNEMANFSRDRNDAYSSAMNNAFTMAGQEASRLQGMDLNSGNFANQAQNQQFNQLMGANNQYFNQATTANQNDFNNRMAANNQFYNQARANTQDEFSNALASSNQYFNQARTGNQDDFANRLAASGQYFNQGTTATQNDFNNQMAAQNQWFNEQMGQANYQNQLRQQQFQEQQALRNMPINEMNALLNGQQVSNPTFASYNQASQGQAANLMGAAQNQYQAQMDQFNAQQAQRNSGLGGLFSLGGTLLGGPIGGAIGGLFK